ncbi:hypothetical protein L1N85_10730 [Paenibacillus alkaliterrae]|uniref:hypothetical protein n=1 Tax=Paenibacillus alkaliterrae TaxID=320909 RepID=UPI001F21EDD9|nr:hypothetical protein [Paenibacillus alkaliterrae]MCF2938911.1 hypothetical protein [Paenibacillus alkaliterrae]
MNDIALLSVVSLILMGTIGSVCYSYITSLQRTIYRQNDTIQRLISREPVTYQEVGAKPTKPNREVYAAWGNQLINIDEDERQ